MKERLYNPDSPGKLLRIPSLLSLTSTGYSTSSAKSVASLRELRSGPSLRSISTVTDHVTAASTVESLGSPASQFASAVTPYVEPGMFRLRNLKFKPHPDDFIVLILGPTGSGKTNFINKITGQAERRGASSLASDTQKVIPYRIKYHSLRLVLVDTPAFGATHLSDGQTLKMIADWLTEKYEDGTTIKIAGIIYLHRITDSKIRYFGKNLQVLGHICGDIALCRTLLVTTMWDHQGDQARAEARETELKSDFWKLLIYGGATVHRFLNTPESAYDIIDRLLRTERSDVGLLLQEELVEQQKRLHETGAGMILYSQLQRLLAEQRRTLGEEAKLQNDPTLARELQDEYEKIDTQLRRTFEEMEEMKIPLSRRILLWLLARKSHAAFALG